MNLRVVPVPLGRVTLPSFHPRSADGFCPIVCHAIDHPDGVIVIDTGPRAGHPLIDELYRPEVLPIDEALARVAIDARDVVAVVNTHLHFDHCGQNHLLSTAPVWLAAAEVEAAKEPRYTVPEWADVEPARLRLSEDGEQLAPGVRLLHTPGHTPGHQSVAIDGETGVELVVGQACYSCADFVTGHASASDMHADGWLEVGRGSLQRLRALRPVLAHFSHDATVFTGPGRATG